MNYRLLLSEMLIDYSERMSAEENTDKRSVYREVIRDLGLALDIKKTCTQKLKNIYIL